MTIRKRKRKETTKLTSSAALESNPAASKEAAVSASCTSGQQPTANSQQPTANQRNQIQITPTGRTGTGTASAKQEKQNTKRQSHYYDNFKAAKEQQQNKTNVHALALKWGTRHTQQHTAHGHKVGWLVAAERGNDEFNLLLFTIWSHHITCSTCSNCCTVKMNKLQTATLFLVSADCCCNH